MANEEHVKILDQGVEAWNHWRKEHPDIKPDLCGINLREDDKSGKSSYIAPRGPEDAGLTVRDFSGVDFSYANLGSAKLYSINFTQANFKRANLSNADLERSLLYKADLSYTFLHDANLSEACLNEANISWTKSDHAIWAAAKVVGADLTRALLITCNLAGADLTGSNLYRAALYDSILIGVNFRSAKFSRTRLAASNLTRAVFKDTNVTGVDFEGATLIETDFEGVDISGSKIYGISAWDVRLAPSTKMNGLVITKKEQPVITVDDLEVAQFVYLLLNNTKIRNLIDTITSKVVLILGRFTEDRKAVLDAIREELRSRNFTPIIFDFDKPASKDVTGTVETLARMARFIIADLTDPSSIPHELATVVPFLRTTPVLPIRLDGSSGYSMFEDLSRSYPWVLKPHNYKDSETLISHLAEVITPADEMAENFRSRR